MTTPFTHWSDFVGSSEDHWLDGKTELNDTDMINSFMLFYFSSALLAKP